MNRSTQHTARQTFSKSEPGNSKLVTNPRFQDRFCRFLVVFDLYHHCARRPYIVQCASADTCDGNWGEWNLSQVRWNWAQFSGPGLTFDLGDFIDNPNGRAAVDISGERIVFPESEYSIIHTKFAFDPSFGKFTEAGTEISIKLNTPSKPSSGGVRFHCGSWSRRGRSDDGRSKDGATFRISRPTSKVVSRLTQGKPATKTGSTSKGMGSRSSPESCQLDSRSDHPCDAVQDPYPYAHRCPSCGWF
jgi:hypothetical protein